MRFELDNLIIDDVLFYMENQDGDFLFDTQKRIVVDTTNNEYDDKTDFYNDERFISLPGWSSADGYRMMEKFAAGLKNPLLREELSAALNRNRGVFRAFRDVLNQYPESEKQWFNYKEQKMKNEVIVWYNSLREEWGLEPIGSEPEDNSLVVLEDFYFREETHCADGICFIAENAGGDLAGRICSSKKDSILCIDALEVNPDYRGMGIGKTLLAKMLEKCDEQNMDAAIDLPCDSDFFRRTLHLENFKPVMQRFIRTKKTKD